MSATQIPHRTGRAYRPPPLVAACGDDRHPARARQLAFRRRACRARQSREGGVDRGWEFTAHLQSSTATAMMISAFTAGGVVERMPALAVMLGADIDTPLIAQLVSFDLSMLSPALRRSAGCWTH